MKQAHPIETLARALFPYMFPGQEWDIAPGAMRQAAEDKARAIVEDIRS